MPRRLRDPLVSSLLILSVFVSIASFAKIRMIPHIARIGGGFDSSVTLENHDPFPQFYRLVPFDAEGRSGPEISGTIGPESVLVIPAAALWDASISHLKILHEGDNPHVSVCYHAAEGPGSPAHVRETDDQSKRWILFPGDWNIVFDGFAAVNVGDAPTEIWVRQFDLEGNLVHAELAVLQLPPMGKGLFVIGAPSGSPFSNPADTWFDISADQPLAVTALRGTPPNAAVGYLWENAALPQEPLNQNPALEALHITELMYHPPDGGAEFLELFNSGAQSIDLSGIFFSDGIDFAFPDEFEIGAGEYIVLISAEADFERAYPDVDFAGVVDGRLSNGGEAIALRNASGQLLISFTYGDEAPWPEQADGLGYSLVLIDPNRDPDDPSNWRASGAMGGSPGRPDPGPTGPNPGDALFEPDHVLTVEIDMDPDLWAELGRQERNLFDVLGEDCMAGPPPKPFTYFPATVIVDGVRRYQAGVRKKGFLGSMNREKPSLKVKFDEYREGQNLLGLERMTLNNCQQDPGFVNQAIAYWLFDLAGIPAPRSNFAHVWVNGRDLGVYAHVEPIKDAFLARQFDDPSGNLYEGTLSDFRDGWMQTFERKNNTDDPDQSDLAAVMDAVGQDDASFWDALEQHVDVEAFLAFWAAEVILGHWDGYAGNTNNFYVYDDPATGVFRFIPWGADACLRSQAPGGPTPVLLTAGVLANRLYRVERGKLDFRDHVLDLLDRVWHEDAIRAELDRMQNLLWPHVRPEKKQSFLSALDDVREYVGTRRDQLREALLPDPPPGPDPLRDPPCMQVIGGVTAQFVTSWGSLGAIDPFLAGNGNMEAEVRQEHWTFPRIGAVAGLEAGLDGPAVVALVADLGDGWVAIALIRTDPVNIRSGMSIELDGTMGFAALFFGEAASQEPFEMIGLLSSGSLDIQIGETLPGARIQGTLNAVLYEAGFKTREALKSMAQLSVFQNE